MKSEMQDLPRPAASLSWPFPDKPGSGDGFDLARRLRHAIWVYDIDRCRVVLANAAALHLWKASSEAELAARDLSKDMSTTVANRLKQYQAGFEESDATFSELWTLYPHGEPVSVDVIYTGYRLPDGRVAMMCEATGIAEDTPETLRSAEALLHTDVMISLFAASGRELYMNPAARNTWRSESTHLSDIFVDPHDLECILRDVELNGDARRVVRIKTDAGLAWHDMSLKSCRDAATGEPATLVTSIDVSELKRARDRAAYLADKDQLTGCYNRSYLQRHLDALGREDRGAPIALLYLDLDKFKQTNDRYGHDAGDKLLVETAQRIMTCLTDADLLARIGGDEFIVLLFGADSSSELNDRIDRIRDAVCQPISYKTVMIEVTTSIGVARLPVDDLDCEKYVRHADIALYESKRLGRNRWSLFTDDMGRIAGERLRTEEELASAFRLGEIVLHVQPCVDLVSGQVVSAEVLARWLHPKRGLLLPVDFIGVCEETGLIEALDHFVLEQGCALAKLWKKAGLNIGLSLNVSPRQFLDDGFMSALALHARDPDFVPGSIQLEITESVLAEDQDQVAGRLRKMTTLGYRIAVDDFGTGYSNLAYISKFPISCIKIDKSFTETIPDSVPVIRLIQRLAEEIGAHTVAEGIEDTAALETLSQIGCRQIQGNYFSAPIPVTDIREAVRRIERRIATAASGR
ncbi:GGDEF-domain containing protein [Roseibium aquae]|uniref:GGDEF-domain containing protein n=1 Tax=Roseibium aquae TaxID=1323746 RepID=A0A916WZI3_9HYPH|nr:EAL domain-containing protein [Roseibium aquae]GGB45507.1 GGDEF-domain containing protein [Roseibium aquae]